MADSDGASCIDLKMIIGQDVIQSRIGSCRWFRRGLTIPYVCCTCLPLLSPQFIMARKTPSESLRLLCRDGAAENKPVVATTDQRILHYKRYLKVYLTSQLLCCLSISDHENHAAYNPPNIFVGRYIQICV